MKRTGICRSKVGTPRKARSELKRSGALKRERPMRQSNPERQAKRRARFKARLNRADWKALRQDVFARDGYRCTALVGLIRAPGLPVGYVRCDHTDETRTGKGLVCDHLTYRRFGHELLDDLRTLCRACDRVTTKATRANWFGNRRKAS